MSDIIRTCERKRPYDEDERKSATLMVRCGSTRSEAGATAVEYAIMLVGIAALLVAIVVLLGRQTTTSFCNQSERMAATERFGDETPSDECAHVG